MVTVYTKTVCPQCSVVKAILKHSDKKVEYINIDEKEEKRALLLEKGFTSLPVVVIKEGSEVLLLMVQMQLKT